jgi:lipopolysaccharide transport system permease protein
VQTQDHALADEKWDMVLRPKNTWYKIDFKSIWEYRDLLILFVRRDFLASYKQTILGPLWVIIQPLLTTLMFIIVFTRIANLPIGENIPPILFYMSGLVPWVYFSDCLLKTSNSFVGNAQIFGKVYFPRLIVPFSIIASNLIKFFIQLSAFVAIYIGMKFSGAQITPDYHLLFLPLLVIILGFLGLSFGLLVSSITTKYRDLVYLIGFGTQLLMYASAVIYDLDKVPVKIKNILAFNPLTSLIGGFRVSFFGQGHWDWPGICYAGCFTLVFFFIALIMFNRVEKDFMDSV